MREKTLLDEDYFDRPGLAQHLHTTTRHLDRLRALGKGPPCIRIAGRIFYRRAAVDEWLRNMESPATFQGRRSKRAGQAEATTA